MSDNLATALAGIALAVLAIGMIVAPADPYMPSIGAVLIIVLVLALLRDRVIEDERRRKLEDHDDEG